MAVTTHDQTGRVAVLSKKDLATHRYDEWLAGRAREVVLFAADDEPTRALLAMGTTHFTDVQLFRDWKTNRAVDLAVWTAHQASPFDRIVSLSEADVVRAAELRAALDIPGQSPASASAYRDKAVMKDRASAAGLATPAYRRVTTVAELIDFATEHPAIVVKPVDGSGSLDIVRLCGLSEVRDWARGRGLSSDEPTRLLVEEWVDAPMVSVDGLMAAGVVVTAFVGAYTRTCLGSVADGRPHGILMLDSDDSRAVAARAYVERLVPSLPGPAELTSFHAELFLTGDGPVLCEIACRTGGGNLDRIAEVALGLSLEYASCLGQAGVPPPVPRSAPAAGRVLGDLVWPRPDGVLRHRPSACVLPGVLELTWRVAVGARTTRAVKVSESIVDGLLEAPDHARLADTYRSLTEWLDRELIWAGSGAG